MRDDPRHGPPAGLWGLSGGPAHLYVCLPLPHLHHSSSQELPSEVHSVWQDTVSRVISACTPLTAQVLHDPTVEELDPAVQLIVDGTLLRCCS